ncbi:xanthine dehydrogenase family protein subunit M [Roseburia hominis]
MFKYNYYRAKSLEEICETLVKYKDKVGIVAGGTDIMVQIREKDKRWQDMECMLDISALEEEMRYIREEGNEIHIGALSTHTDLERSDVVKKYIPFLGKAASTVGSPQIRNRGTIGGSICNASPAADPLTPLIALDARVVIHGPKGEREELLRDFYVGKGKVDLKEGEFLKEFVVEKLPQNVVTEFVKLGRRKALAISRLNVSIALGFDAEGVIDYARVAPGCIFVTPDRVVKAEQLLVGKKPSDELWKEAGKAVSEEMIARTGVRWSTEYKKPAVEGIVEEALEQIAEKAVR